MAHTPRLGELQLAILRVLWARGEASVADVHLALLPDRGLALTTVATMLTKMERKGVVDHRVEKRRFYYRATVREDVVSRSMVQDLVDRLFQGDPSALVHHLVSEGDLDAGELEALRKRIAACEDGGRDGR